ncbi:MAG: M56 family metallopeptidase [Eubacteriales bacterium]|nr:M56 family metallopeptidase [Eubacteriales bacterium]
MTQLFENILTASFHGSIVIAVILLLRPFLRRAPRKFFCLLWLMAGLRLLIPLEISSPVSLQPESFDNVPAFAAQDRLPSREPGGVPDFFFDQAPVVEPEAQPVRQQTAQAPETPEVPDTPEVPGTPAVQPTVQPVRIDWTEAAAFGYLAVVALIGLYCLMSYGKLRRKLREAIRVKEGIWVCDRISTAFILGYVRPRIYIPMGISRSNCKHILAHERTHLEKGDHWFKLLGFIVLAVHWFNPLVWLAYYLLCKDIEMACDERVVQFMELEDRKSYSAALLACSAGRAHLSACPVAFGEVSVKERVHRVLKYRKPSFWISLAAVIALAFVAVCFLTSPKEEETPVPETTQAAETQTQGQPEATGEAASAAPATVTVDANHDLSDMMEPISQDDYVDPFGYGLVLYTYEESTSGMGYGISFNRQMKYDDRVKLGRGVSFTGEYWLEEKTDSGWKPVEPKAQPTFDDAGLDLSEGHYQTRINWHDTYGDLYDGHFRLGKNLDINGEACTYYVEFYILDNDPEKEPEVAAVMERINSALSEIASRECVQVVTSGESIDPYGSRTQRTDVTSAGTDHISIESGEGMNASNYQSASFGGTSYVGHLGQWYQAGERSDTTCEDWARSQMLKGYHVTVQDSGASDKISLMLDRMEYGFTRSYRDFYFDAEGRLTQIQDTSYYKIDGQLCKRHTSVEIYQAEKSSLTTQLQAIQTNAGNHTYEELDQLLREEDFDENFSMGAGSFVWRQADWAYRIGGQEGSASATGVMVDHEFCGSESQGTLYTQGAFWIERLENEKWSRVPVPAGNPLPPEEAKLIFDTNGLTAPTRMRCDWSESYGVLEPGFYRVAQNYKLTAGGQESIKTCYAKFRVYDPNGERYLAQVRQGMEDLLNRESYYIEIMEDNYRVNQVEGSDVRLEYIWKRDNQNFFRSYQQANSDRPVSYSQMLDGKGYSCSGEPGDGWEYVAHFDRENFEFWHTHFDMFDSLISSVEKNGNDIIVNHDLSEYPQKFIFTFDDSGRLIAGKAYELMGEKPVLGDEFKVANVSQESLDNLFAKNDITKPATFSFAEDEKLFGTYAINKTSGFINTSPVTISTAQEAEERAKNDCTLLPFEDETGVHEGGWNLTKAFFDAEAQMWKVEFTFSQGGVYQAVYMTADGVTTHVIG